MKPVRTRLRLESLESREVPTILGTLDTTFGNGGKLVLPNSAALLQDGGPGLELDAQGRFVALGMPNGYNGPPTLLRMNPDGTPDTTFGTNGSVTLGPAITDSTLSVGVSPTQSPISVAVDSTGRILVLGHVGVAAQPTVTRFTADGAIDTSFGEGGTTVVPVPAGVTNYRGGRIAVDAGGNVWVVDQWHNQPAGFPGTIGVARLTPDGQFDPAFNGGAVQSVTALSDAVVGAITIDPRGRLVVAGESGGVASGFYVLRVTADGSLDPSFNGTGYRSFTTQNVSNANLRALTTDAAGNVYIGGAGFDFAAGVSKVVVVKLAESGSFDTSFGSGGTYRLPLYPSDESLWDSYSTVRGLAVQSDGHVIVATTVCQGDTLGDFAVLRLTPNGTLDTSFNPVGEMPGVNKFDFAQSENDLVQWVRITPEGQILVAASGGYFTTPVTKVARLNGTGDEIIIDWGGWVVPEPFGEAGVPTRVAKADVNADGFVDDIYVTRAGKEMRVAVLGGRNQEVIVAPFDPFGDNFTGGGFVTAGDFDGDGAAEIVVTADTGGGGRAAIFSVMDGSAVLRSSFMGIEDANFRGGARVAVGDINGDGVPDLIAVAGTGGGPRVAVFDGTTVLTDPRRLVEDFFAMPGGLVNGVYVGSYDMDGDGLSDLIFGAGPGGAPRVRVLSAKLLLTEGPDAANQAPLHDGYVLDDRTSRGGVRIVIGDDVETGITPEGTEPPKVFQIQQGPDVSGGTTFTMTRLGPAHSLPSETV